MGYQSQLGINVFILYIRVEYIFSIFCEGVIILYFHKAVFFPLTFNKIPQY